MIFKLVSSIFLLSLSMTNSYAAVGSGVKGGGDEVGLEFQASFNTALENLKTNNSPAYNVIYHSDIKDIFKKAKIITVDDALDVTVKDLIQTSVAINIPSTNTVMINRSRWNNITDFYLKEAIALHEILSLVKLEQTGSYPYSAQYLAMMGSDSKRIAKELSVDRIKQLSAKNPKSVPYENLKAFFDEASSAANLDDFDVKGDSTSNQTCQGVTRTYQFGASFPNMFKDVVGKAPIAKENVVVADEIEDRGPLMPGQPEKKEWMINISLSNGWQIYPSFLGAKLTTIKKDLVEDAPNFFQQDGGKKALPAKIYFRKNNGNIAFFIDSLVNDANQFTRITYGYCYRK